MSQKDGGEGQTREHALLSKAYGIRHLVVFVNKMDQVSWDIERYNFVKDETSRYLKKIGYPQEECFFLPGSGLSSQNVSQPYRVGWWDGPCLLQVLSELDVRRNRESPKTRVSVICHLSKGLLFGKVERGKISVGEELVLCPNRASLTVQALSTDFEKEKIEAEAGENIFLSFSCQEMPRQGDFLVFPAFCHFLRAKKYLLLSMFWNKPQFFVPARLASCSCTCQSTSAPSKRLSRSMSQNAHF
ncbi:hypothetical protein GMAR_ORF66 [Golden Marseillevirus]|uniref:hypothetical protein n=1 Tax=Golden Marseillevirus TaxID=1720526 RepID=UPI000877AC54|nr:hypothetical protein GMAR_ORF66 [Golden Marseillevirus]ALX27441.1 hypothetical protein GMAR_ORF66 [Golden Marseillevirus]